MEGCRPGRVQGTAHIRAPDMWPGLLAAPAPAYLPAARFSAAASAVFDAVALRTTTRCVRKTVMCERRQVGVAIICLDRRQLFQVKIGVYPRAYVT